MKAKLDKWESYTDAAGRRHWRWLDDQRQVEINPRAETGPRAKIGLPQAPQPRRVPMRTTDK
jgi:hypothetical protein